MDVAFWLRASSLSIFTYTAIHDLRYRSAPNQAWVALLVLGLTARTAEMTAATRPIPLVIGSFGALLVWWSITIAAYQQKWIGGADAKALLVVPIVFPRLPGEVLARNLVLVFQNGLEVLVVVWLTTGILGVFWPLKNQITGDVEGVPFLLPILGSVVSLFGAGLVLS